MGGFATALGALVLGAGAGWGIHSATKGSKSGPSPLPMPQAPKAEDATAQAEGAAQDKLRRMKRTRTVFTSPLGIGGEADVARKKLLGQ